MLVGVGAGGGGGSECPYYSTMYGVWVGKGYDYFGV